MRVTPLAFVILASCVSFARGGSNTSDHACNVTYDCAAGQTCWTQDGASFVCAPSGPGALGSPCNPIVHPGDTPPCGDGMGCAAFGPPVNGTCLPFCGAGDACASGTTCLTARNPFGAVLKICVACNVRYACAAGQTCGSSDGASWSCVPSGPGAEGSACETSVGSSCGDGLACLATGGDPTKASCVPWCDAHHTCGAGETCTPMFAKNGATLLVCK
jgi:hypothetical protein